jgi:hypothetical protein
MAKLFHGNEVLDNWSPLDGVQAPEFVPPQWTGPHVGRRLADAWLILARMPWRSPYPRAFGQTWPNYKLEWFDLLAIVGGGELEAVHREQNRTRILPSARQITEMELAISWPMKYLREAQHVLVVNTCARVDSFNGDLAVEIKRRRYDGEADQWRRSHWKHCDRIADGLIGHRVVVF